MKRGLQASNGSNSGSLSASRPDLHGDADKKAEVSKYQEKMLRKRKSRMQKKMQDKLRKFAKIAGKKSTSARKEKSAAP